MSREGSPWDLNNLPEDFTGDGKHDYEDTATSGQRGKKKNAKDDESGKIYECRFCPLKFGKSQALGGHMNRHRQERETETLNKARQLVYSSDQSLSGHPIPPLGSYVQQRAMVYPSPSSHQVYPTTSLMYSGKESTVIQPPRQQYTHHHHQSHANTSSALPRLAGDYYMIHGHALPRLSHVYNNDFGPTYSLTVSPVGIHGLDSSGHKGLDRDEYKLATSPLSR